jgi:hypothetical protein
MTRTPVKCCELGASERAARAVLTRRNLFAAGGALAAGSVFSFPKPELWPASRSSILADLEDSIRTFTARAKTRPVMIFHPEAARAWARSIPGFADELRRAGLEDLCS